MKVLLADRIGFCFGVKRALRMAETALGRKKTVTSLGSIIHNTQAVEKLRQEGLETVRDLGAIGQGAVLISSHGAPPRVFREIRARGLGVIDTTCPFVSHAQGLARRMAESGYTVVIVGEASHPEVKALAGFASGKAVVVRDAREACAAKGIEGLKVAVISQTTQAVERYFTVVRALLEKRPQEIRVFNTICNDTGKRQASAVDLAKRVDVMIIVGGRHSANTARLFEVCARLSTAHLVETEDDIQGRWFRGKRSVGVASGASTPRWIIERVVERLNRVRCTKKSSTTGRA